MVDSVQVHVIEKHEGSILFSCAIEELEQAYAYATQMEEMRIEIYIQTPTILETLAYGLGLNGGQQHDLMSSAQQELEDHDCIGCSASIQSSN